MLNIGLTGGIGSGKSTVARWFVKQGVPVLDADKTVHRLLQLDPVTISKLAEEFGLDILEHDGHIDRSKLGKQVFKDDDARKRLERIVHPRVIESMKEEQNALNEAGAEVCIWDVPLLFEAGFDKFVDEVWVVWVPRDVQISRVLVRDKLSREEVEARLAAQESLDEKRLRADVVIDNSGSEDQTLNQLINLWDIFLHKQLTIHT
ncbi:dephospho-CoA kinase [Desulfosporosinus orientis DSM 765]|uniref:Dephospho-CoA kinase n=1 Tax=Desulfosporosinus orientis (strain ATCC 19365 / DSM 765 / NCIMB 8382 / VKM B-1628 / Singapore I) TaxID=768706 RepID=G7WIJ4_DESOD|nr:dephospho-CoA kinase [Desulfosporosinus orientis]AET69068.1 dephospho-CoA kinase [Desulfosporosinus orientis DSM 765]